MANPPTSLPAIPATPVPIPGTPGPAHVPASGAGSPPAANGVAHATNAPPPPAPMELDPVALMVRDFWATNHDKIDQGDVDFKYHPLPLARIKKVMKSDPDIKQMISSEAPLVFSKACELFIAELTLRAWMVAEENKRRTLQRGDIMAAVSKSDQYDFLIDIIPREDPDAIPRKRYTKDSQNNQQHPSSIPGMLYDPSAAGSAPPGFPMMGHMPYAPMQFGAGGPYMDPNAAAAAAAAMVMPPQFAHFHPGAPGMPVQPSLPPGFLPQYPMQQGFLPSQHQHQQQPQPQSQQHQQPMNMFAPNQMQHQHLQQQQQPPPQQQQGGGPPRSILSPPPNASQPHSIPMVSPPPGQMHFTHSATPPTPGSAKHPSGTHPLYSPPATSMSMQPLPGSASSTHSQFTTPPTSATYPIGQPLMHRPATSTSGEPTPQSATFATSVMGLDHAQFQQQQGGAQSVGATPVQTPHSATFGGAQFAAAQQQQQQMQHQQQQHQHQHQQQQQHQHQQGLAAMLGAMGGQQQQMQMQSGSGNVAADGTGGVS